MRVRGLETALVERWRSGAPDANGQAPLLRSSTGADPCRHCLALIAPGDQKLVLSHRPFPRDQPYAERGPIFVHREACERYEGERFPDWFGALDPAMIRGYDADDWIRYDTGEIVAPARLGASVEAVLADPSIAYVHVRSKFGCFQCRVDRA